MTLWAGAFALTQIIETPIYGWALRRAGRPLGWAAAIAFGASAITHPVVWFWLPALDLSAGLYVAVAESFAVVVEALYLRAAGLRWAIIWALGANLLSALIGWWAWTP